MFPIIYGNTGLLNDVNGPVESFIEFIDSIKDKSIYLVLPINKILKIESILKLKGIHVSRIESDTGVVISTGFTHFLKKKYSIYIYRSIIKFC